MGFLVVFVDVALWLSWLILVLLVVVKVVAALCDASLVVVLVVFC